MELPSDAFVRLTALGELFWLMTLTYFVVEKLQSPEHQDVAVAALAIQNFFFFNVEAASMV